jgi:hypothetical protein
MVAIIITLGVSIPVKPITNYTKGQNESTITASVINY